MPRLSFFCLIDNRGFLFFISCNLGGGRYSAVLSITFKGVTRVENERILKKTFIDIDEIEVFVGHIMWPFLLVVVDLQRFSPSRLLT